MIGSQRERYVEGGSRGACTTQGTFFALHSSEQACCPYSSPCAPPPEWRVFDSDTACQDQLRSLACTPGETRRIDCKVAPCPASGRWPTAPRRASDMLEVQIEVHVTLQYPPGSERPRDGWADVERAATALLDHTFDEVVVTGVPDAKGGPPLAQARGEQVRKQLIQRGVPAASIRVDVMRTGPAGEAGVTIAARAPCR